MDLNDSDSRPNDQQCKPADIAHNDDWSDTQGCDDIDPEPLTIGQYFDLALIKKREGALERYSGDKVTFDITVYNQGTLDASNVQINDYIPQGLILDDSNWQENGGVATLKSPIAQLAKGEQTTVTITFKIARDFHGDVITNNAEIAAASNRLGKDDIDSTPASEDGTTPDPNDDDTADTTGGDDYDPAIVKVKPANVSPEVHEPGRGEDCDCNTTDKVDAMNWLALWLMLMATVTLAQRAFNREESVL